ncbi:SPFH domain-containing protein [Dyella terrae]|uniref:SPFH domain-containing protein n=1 Tax=Dyella TaxID=231454 RepID=UPI00269B6390
MKHVTKVALAAAVCLGLTGCHFISVDPGTETVLVDKPFIFGHGGVQPTAVTPGRVMAWASTTGISIVMTPQTVHVAFDDFSSKDNILLDFDTAIQYRVTDSVKLVQNYGAENWFKNNVQSQYASIVREAVKGQTMGDMMSNPATATTVDKEVSDAIRALIKERGLPVEVLDVTLGRARPNPDVLKQMNETAAQQQRQKTLAAATIAEEQRAKEQDARAIADNAYRNKLGLSVEQYSAITIATINADACKAAKECYVTPVGANVLVGGR